MGAPSLADLPPLENEYMELALRRLRANPEDADALLVLGAWLFLHGHAKDALDCFCRVTRANPTYPGIWRLTAKAFEALGDEGNAERCRRRGANPDS